MARPNVVASGAGRAPQRRTDDSIPAASLTLRASIEALSGEQAIELQAGLTANTGQIIAMGIALLVMLASIIG